MEFSWYKVNLWLVLLSSNMNNKYKHELYSETVNFHIEL